MHKQQLFTIVSFLLFTCLISILAVKSLSERLSQVEFMKSLSDQASDQNYCTPSGIISDACCEYETVENMNDDLSPRLRELIKTDFFKYYKLKLYKECPFWSEYGQCINQACAVETTDETDVPEMWRSNVLGALQTSQAGTLFQPFIKCEYTDQDFCVVEDETDSEGVFVNLLDNPERFTGYAGTSAGRVWKSIYEENCFNVVSSMDPANNNLASVSTSKNQLPEDVAQKIDTTEIEEVCFEKRVYYRLISGLHSSISIHICDEYLNQTTGQWGPNLECFINRIGSHPERLQNIYFSYVVLLRAISKAADYLNGYEFCTGDKIQDLQVKAMVGELVNKTRTCPETFDEKQMFASPESRSLKEEFKNRFRNVSRIMDCVGCDKCRLWGKLQISGLGTALKVLFSYEDEFFNPKVNPNLLTRTEIVALFNTFHRFSESLTSIERFRQMYQEKINEAAKSEIESTKSIINQLLESLPEKYIEAIISIKDLLSSYLIQFNRLIIQQLEYWDIPVPVLLTSSTAS